MLRENLGRLRKDLLTMASLVESAVRKAMITLTDRQSNLVDEIISGDRMIDALENTIDKTCTQILCLQQPVADDLRMVLLVLMANNELERIGDHAKNIARSSRTLAELPPLPVYRQLDEIGQLASQMLTRSLDALFERNTEIAEAVRASDERVDRLCDALTAEVIQLMKNNRDSIDQGVHILRCVQNLERIADLATNIAKDLIFYVGGEIVRHGGRMFQADGREQVDRRG